MTNSEIHDLIGDLAEKMLDLFLQEIPHDIMKTEKGVAIMVDTTLNVLFRLGFATTDSEKELVQWIEEAMQVLLVQAAKEHGKEGGQPVKLMN